LDHSFRFYLHVSMTILVSGISSMLPILHECMSSEFMRNDDGVYVLIGIITHIFPFHIPKNVPELMLL
jgi:hypothetical protein